MHYKRMKKHGVLEIASKRQSSARKSRRMRARWETIRKINQVVGWKTFSEFLKDVGDSPGIGYRLVAINPEEIIGPGNHQWIASPAKEKMPRQQLAAVRKSREYNLVRSYGITESDYTEMLVSQKGVCAICSKPETAFRNGVPLQLSVDHCHKTNAVRGLLCTLCNRGLGLFKDNLAFLKRAYDYLRERQSTETTILEFKEN